MVVIRIISESERSELTVPLSEVRSKLLPTLDTHGCAIITGVCGDEELRHLQQLFGRDLLELLPVSVFIFRL